MSINEQYNYPKYKKGRIIMNSIPELEFLCETVMGGGRLPELVIIRGIPGSGKSTFAKNQFPNHARFETDQFFVDPRTGEYRFDPSMLGRNHGRCFGAVARSLERGKDTVVSNTFTKLWEMEKYIDFCKRNGIDFKVYRMQNRFPNEHGVPDDKVEMMLNRFEDYPGEIVIKDNLKEGSMNV